MRTPTLQYLYLQKPVTMMVVICIISVLPWIGLGDFSTKGEPREAAVAISMLETGNWVLPQSYATDGALVNGCFLLSTGICFRVHLPLAIGFSLYYLDRVRIGLFR